LVANALPILPRPKIPTRDISKNLDTARLPLRR